METGSIGRAVVNPLLEAFLWLAFFIALGTAIYLQAMGCSLCSLVLGLCAISLAITARRR